MALTLLPLTRGSYYDGVPRRFFQPGCPNHCSTGLRKNAVLPASAILARAMSQENVEIVRRTIETFNREGVEAALEYFDAGVEWLGPPEWLEEHLYEGHDGIRRIASVWGENFDEYRLDPEKFIDAGVRSSLLSSSAVGSKAALI